MARIKSKVPSYNVKSLDDYSSVTVTKQRTKSPCLIQGNEEWVGATESRYKYPIETQFCNNECGSVKPSWMIDGTETSITFEGNYAELYTGVFRLFIENLNASDVIKIRFSDVNNLADYNEYEITTSTTAGEFLAYTVALFELPDSVGGLGWTPSTAGFTVTVEAPSGTYVSTPEFYEEVEDLECSMQIKLSCISEQSLSRSLEVTESMCSDAETTESALEFSFTAMQQSDDYSLLTDGVSVQRDGEMFRTNVKSEVEVKLETINGIDYGVLSVNSGDVASCKPVSVLLNNLCYKDKKGLKLVQNCAYSFNQELSGNEFAVGDEAYDVAFANRILVPAEFVGQVADVCIIEKVIGTVYAYGDSFEDSNVDILIEDQLSDGRTRVLFLPNVKITSESLSLGRSEKETIEISGTAYKDEEGNRMYKTHV